MKDETPLVAAGLGEFWREKSICMDGTPASVVDLVAATDSFTATEALERLEKIVGIGLPAGQRIRSGGYDNKAQFVEHTLVDATIIAVPSSTKNEDGQRDSEMHQAKKGNQWHFGMKVRTGVDAKSGLICT